MKLNYIKIKSKEMKNMDSGWQLPWVERGKGMEKGRGKPFG